MPSGFKTVGWMTVLLVLGCAPASVDKVDRPEGADPSSSYDDDLEGGDNSDEDDGSGEGGSGGDSEEDDSSGGGPSTDTDDRPEREEEEGDAAVLISANLPTTLGCGEVGTARVTMRNIGTTTWSRDEGYKLGMVDDEDPFYGPDTRIWLPEGTVVPPGSTYSFNFEMTAPSAEGSYTSDWQMVHEYVGWFGDETSAEVNVVCDGGGGGSSEWVEEACARNGAEICDDEVFGIEHGRRYGLHCAGPEGGIGYISRNTGPVMSDGMERCQGWEERGEDAWDSLDYVHSFVCNSDGIVEVDLSEWAGSYLWFGSHDHPGGGGHMTNICLVSQPE